MYLTGQSFLISHLFPVFCSQWTISELACYTYSMVAVPLYDTLGKEAIGYVIEKGTQEGNPYTLNTHIL